MAKIEHVHHRLERWAIWMHRGGVGAGTRTHPMWAGIRVDCDDSLELPIPVNDEEATRTHAAIQALPSPLAETIAVYYLWDSGFVRRKLDISSSTLSQRIDQAHRLLEVAFRRPPGEGAGAVQSWEARVAGSFTP